MFLPECKISVPFLKSDHSLTIIRIIFVCLQTSVQMSRNELLMFIGPILTSKFLNPSSIIICPHVWDSCQYFDPLEFAEMSKCNQACLQFIKINMFLRFCYMLILGIICLHSRSAAFCHEAAFAHLACFCLKKCLMFLACVSMNLYLVIFLINIFIFCL